MKEKHHELKSLPAYFYETCGRYPSSPAQRYNALLHHGDNNGRFTYAEMRDRVEKIGCGLLSLGMNRQDRVGLMTRTGPYRTQAEIAVSSCAAVSVNLCSTLSGAKAVSALRGSGARFLFTDIEKGLAGELPGIEKVIVMDLAFHGSGGRAMGLAELMEKGARWREANGDAYHACRQGLDLDDLCTVLCTPNAPGEGVLLTHRCVSSRIEGLKRFFSLHGMAITQDDITLCHLPVPDSFERCSCELLALFKGACVSYADDAGTLLKDLRRYNPTWLHLEPLFFKKIYSAMQEGISGSPVKERLFAMALHVGQKALDYRRDHRGCYNMSPTFGLRERLPLVLRTQYGLADKLFAKLRPVFGSRLRFALTAGSGMTPELIRFFSILGIAVLEGYGSFEGTDVCLLNPLTGCKPGYSGIETGRFRARIGQSGELQISGPGMFTGHLREPGSTEGLLTADGWLKTGEAARTDGYGYYRIMGREPAGSGKNILRMPVRKTGKQPIPFGYTNTIQSMK